MRKSSVINSVSSDRQQGFTLIELVVVIAIIGVLAAISVPMITNFLGDAKSQAYDAETPRIQTASDGYLTWPGNQRFIGLRQYALIGRGQTPSLWRTRPPARPLSTTAIHSRTTASSATTNSGTLSAAPRLPTSTPCGRIAAQTEPGR